MYTKTIYESIDSINTVFQVVIESAGLSTLLQGDS